MANNIHPRKPRPSPISSGRLDCDLTSGARLMLQTNIERKGGIVVELELGC
jgi:hypothetical protein